MASTRSPAPRLLSTKARPFAPVVWRRSASVRWRMTARPRLARIAHGFRSTGFDQPAGDLGEIEHVRSVQHREAQRGGLQHVVTAALDQRPAHERDVGRGVEQGQLPHGVADEHLRAGAVRGPARTQDELEPPPAGQRRRVLESLGMARHENQHAARNPIEDPLEGIEHQILLTFVRTRRDPDSA